ncbi:MAG TPA: PQQ-binding-like beta-propeller repeat protein [Streptosporangiaceae bacterium]|nr:PQQ-binding-like beta-propeller repeat protein [Streptosporangiaceae bacterium]
MSNHARTVGCRPAVAGAALVLAAGLIAGGCSSSSSSSSSALTCPSKRGAAVTGTAPAATGRAAAGWTQPDADLASTRYVASAITSADVSKLGVAWTVPLTIPTTHTDGAYAATPVIVNGVVYVQDLQSNVYAISLATGKVLWRHDYNSPNGGPDGVNVAGGVVYAATAKAAVALDAATGAQMWSRTLIGNDHEGIAMAPGYNRGTVYVSTVPANVTGQYLPGGEGILWALNAETGVPEWSWNQVQNLWGNPGVNSGGGLWYTPSFDAQGNIYLGIANPGPIFGTKSYPLGSSRPGPNLYTDSVVKLSPAGKLLWYYQLTSHDLYDWDLQNPPVLSTANGQQVVIDGGKAGIMIELDAQTGKLLWQRSVGGHDGHEHDGLLTEHATPTSRGLLPAKFCLEPSIYGGVLTQLASNGSTTFAAVNDLAMPASPAGFTGSLASHIQAIENAVGEMVAVNQDTGTVIWDTPLPSSPYGAATVTNDIVFTTTFKGDLYALDATTGAILFQTPMSAGSNAPVAVDGDYVIAGAGVTLASTQRNMIIAYKLGATGKLPDTVGS